MRGMPMTPSHAVRALRDGFRFSWITLLLILAIDTAIALVLWIDDPRPFWQPLLTVQLFGLSIAYCVNIAAPWDHDHPLRRLVVATFIGSLIGVTLVIFIKGYGLSAVREKPVFFLLNLASGFGNGLLICLIFFVKRREARAAAELHKAEAERHLLSKQAVEADLALMQAQVEPHFLFNTLASVQYLIETDPGKAGALLGHLIEYLRAALPQLRVRSSTLAREMALAQAYLSILAFRLGPRLRFAIDVPGDLRDHSFPPNLLISLVENAIKHGIEPSADGGSVTVAARCANDALVVSVSDTGAGNGAVVESGKGVGLSNIRERLAALYGERGRFRLEPLSPRGTRATIELPLAAEFSNNVAQTAHV